ncbi:MAG TPA: DUF6624 domain-containing protein [Gemmataceae bacterium]|nr:DUF6624 domain-containing protein [Gemmataceae bacterium]
MDVHLRERLLDMVAEQRRVHTELSQTGELYQGRPMVPRLAEVVRRHVSALEAIIEEHGWPGKSLVGEDGSHAAWFLMQHAIERPDLQRRGLLLLRAAVARGEAAPAQAAYLEDKIAFFERRPQRYGTQFDWDAEGRMSPWLLEDPERVDEYRSQVGLSPLQEKIEEFGKDEHRPADYEQYRREMLAWAKSIGWF